VEFVPASFRPPAWPASDQFDLEPLGPEHNEADYTAWSSSIDHIHSSPGWEKSSWPREMSLEENRRDLERHADDFAKGAGFTYTVREPAHGAIFGCVYIYPAKDDPSVASVESWVTADRAELDQPLRAAVRRWLEREWPFASIDYAG
jgi:hypothetical protein